MSDTAPFSESRVASLFPPKSELFPNGTRTTEDSARFEEHIRNRLAGGVSAEAIANECGVTKATIYARVFKMRNNGDLPKAGPGATRNRVLYRLRSSGKELGQRGEIFKNLSIEAGEWLVSAVPEGMTLYEFVGSLIADAFIDEQEE